MIRSALKNIVRQAFVMYSCHPRYPPKEADFDLLTSRLYFQVFGSSNFREHGYLLPFDPPIIPLQFLAPFPQRIGRAVQPLMRLDAMRLAAPQVNGHLAIDGPALGWF